MRESSDSQHPLRSVDAGREPADSAQLWVGAHIVSLGTSATLEKLATRAQRFTPRVSLVPPDGLLLEVKGSLHLFNGVEGLLRAFAQRLPHARNRVCQRRWHLHRWLRWWRRESGRAVCRDQPGAARRPTDVAASGAAALAGGRHSSVSRAWVFAPSARLCACRAPVLRGASDRSTSPSWIA